MHLRKLVLGFGCALLLLSNTVAALGLGEIRLNSTLNEPLNAEIKLLDTRGLNSDQIIVALGSPADFERNGVERLYFFTEFQFDIVLNHPGGAIVRITSRNPVREPFVNFLVEARWPTGRLLREYTLLMDLPTFADDVTSAAPVQQPARQSTTAPSSAPVARSLPQQQRTATPAPARETSRPAPSRSSMTADSYTVNTNDTLWEIALDVRPDSSHSVHQTMLAIQRMNPDAFINNNINLLRRGQVLRIPSSEDILAVSRRDAVNDVARQNRAWADDSMGAQLSASRRDSGARRESDSLSGSVKLATPSSGNASGGQGSGENTGSGRALESELASSLEELDKTRSENRELSSRVRDLEDQIKTMERLVEVSNEQLRALQLGAAQAEQAAQTESDTSITQEADLGVEDEALTADTSVPIAEPVVVVEEPAPVVSPPPVVDSRRVVAPPPKPKSLVDLFMENLLWVIGGIAVLIGLVAFVLHRRKQAIEDQEYATDDDMFDMESEEPEDEYEHDGLDLGQPEEEEVPDFDEEIPAEAETGDVVGEADIYIAYGKFDQAEEMLLNGLAKEPESTDVRLKLLEVYSQTQDVHKFDKYYAGLLGVAGPSVLARAAELRSHIPDAGTFDPLSHESSSSSAGVDIATEDSISLDTESESPFADSEDLAFEDDLDFSLDLEDESPSADSSVSLTEESDLRTGDSRYDLSFSDEPLLAPEEDELSLDFDLDDEDTEVSPASTSLSDEADELSFSLDDEPASEAVVAPKAVADDEDFGFDFEEDAAELELHEAETASPLTESSEDLSEDEVEELQLPDDVADEFNLDMDVEGLDLAALDHEMESLDADFEDAELEDTAVSLDDEQEAIELDLERDGAGTLADEEFNLDDLDSVTTGVDQPAAISEADEVSDDDVFDRALSEFAPDDTEDSESDMSGMADLSDDDMDAELDFLADADEAATKLDLARAYIDMGDTDGARDILAEVTQEGNDQQRQEAAELLGRIDA